MLFIAQDWLVLQLSDNSPTALGVVTALQFAPVLLLTLYGGKLADRFDKRRLLLIANVAFARSRWPLGVLVVTGVVNLWWVFVTGGADRRDQRHRDAGPAGVRLRAGRRRAAAQRAVAVLGHVQHRPGRRPGDRRRGHRAASTTGPVFLLTARAVPGSAGRAEPDAHRGAVRPDAAAGDRRARPASSTACATSGTAPTSPADRAGARGRPVRLQLPAHPGGAGEERFHADAQ